MVCIGALNLVGLPWGLAAQETELLESSVQEGVIDEEAEIVTTAEQLEDGITHTLRQHTNLLIRLGIAAAIVVAQVLLIRLIWHLFKKLQTKLNEYGQNHFKPLVIKEYRILETAQMMNLAAFLLRLSQYVAIIIQLYLTLPLVFSLFEPTKHLASTLFGYILNPLQTTALSIIDYIPNLITIVIIIVISRYALRTIKFFTTQIESGKLVIPGFYADWATPSFNILRVLLYAFTIIVIYPNLPHSESPVFQGVSMFVGLVFSLGSSSIIGNLVAGIVITYMRPFTIGDRIKLNDVTGFVVEKSATVTRLRTHKNEFVTFPNMMLLTSSITNYNFSTVEKEDGLILHADVTMGYAIPWQQVHEILLTAAANTPNVLKKPKPYVLQTALWDYYAHYEINVFVKAVDKVPRIYSDLYENLQNGFKAANIDLTAPSYQVFIPPSDKEEAPEPPPVHEWPRDPK
jgi:small-conductance mechanosensitive channel